MTRSLFARLMLAAVFSISSLSAADAPGGAAIFRSNCAFCHGLGGRGGRGPSLITARVAQNISDAELRTIIKNGIAGTGMPAFDMEEDDLNALITHVRSLGGNSAQTGEVKGDTAHGKSVYASNACSGCHRIGTTGSIYGPELTRVGSARSPEYLRESIVSPSADIVPDYGGAVVMTRDGKRVAGVILNEDSFTIQLRLPDQQFAFFQKADLQSSEDLLTSLMPSYRTLPEKDLDDLIAYLSTLRGGSASGDVTKARGIH